MIEATMPTVTNFKTRAEYHAACVDFLSQQHDHARALKDEQNRVKRVQIERSLQAIKAQAK
ncbi:MAG TPA: hypothetical protein VMF08_10400 [Candidatus Sulfotelmatobacter sp.]|nr:hypothetical protein [Candidatus Sulfotelmatobacter sp.]